MKSSSIGENVFEVNLRYSRLQNKTKELFFKCLDEGRDVDYFRTELEKLWGQDDTKYLEEQIIEYMAYLHEENTNQKYSEIEKKSINVEGIVLLAGAILLTNQLFERSKVKEYQIRLESYAYESDKYEYLKKLVPKYTNDIKAYYKQGKPKTRENIVRFVSPNTYNSMVYNTTVTRNSWIQTLNDANEYGQEYLYIPHHSFSCPYCVDHQEKKMTVEECYDILGTADETQGDLLHPNCKCELAFWNSRVKLKKLNKGELTEQYQIREKVMSLTLEKERLLSDKRIYKRLDFQDDVDKTNQKIKKVNSSIKELQSALPTTQLKKQVVAINR